MKSILFAICLLWIHVSFAQSTYIIYLQDKDLKEQNLVQITDRSLERRRRNSVQNDVHDIPLNSEQVSELSKFGRVIKKSRWLNAIVLESDHDLEDQLSSISFVKGFEKIEKSVGSSKNKFEDELNLKSFNYGRADTQIRQLGLDCVHASGHLGSGVFLAFLDAGYNGMDTISYFDRLYVENRVIDTFDYVGSGGVYSKSGHGTAVASCVLAEREMNERYYGAARDVDIALYVTEDVSSETQLEEFNLVMALERCDSIGVDVVNISLGYFDFDGGKSYTYEDMDGQTTISAIGATIAASKGILVVTSAGNDGPGQIGTPCDADSIICAGATDWNDNYAWFSSVGPSFNGRVKPDLAAQGGQTAIIWEDGSFANANGTSFSSPMLAGLASCLVGAFPSLTAQDIILLMKQNAHQFGQPDSLLGYGIPNMCPLFAGNWEQGMEQLIIYPNPFEESIQLKALTHGELIVYDAIGRVIYQDQIVPGIQAVKINNWSPECYTFEFRSEQGSVTKRVVKN